MFEKANQFDSNRMFVCDAGLSIVLWVATLGWALSLLTNIRQVLKQLTVTKLQAYIAIMCVIRYSACYSQPRPTLAILGAK